MACRCVAAPSSSIGTCSRLRCPASRSCSTIEQSTSARSKELCKRFNPPVYKKLSFFVDKQEKHRVEPDLYDTLGEANYYIDNFLHVSI